MMRAKYQTRTILLRTRQQADLAVAAIQNAPLDAENPLEVVIREQVKGRNLEQSSKFHAICGDIAKSGTKWAGKHRTAMEWKCLLVSGHAIATQEGSEVVPGLEGEFINLRESTALMSKRRSSSLIEYSIAWCCSNSIKLHFP